MTEFDYDPSRPTAPQFSEAQRFVMISTIINSALYCLCIVIAGVIWGNSLAVLLAIATLGVSYLCTTVQTVFDLNAPLVRLLVLVLLAISIATGVSAGLALILG